MITKDERMSKLTDNDKQFGFVTYGKTSRDCFGIRYEGSGETGFSEPRSYNTITGHCLGWVAQIKLSNILKPVVIDKGYCKVSFRRAYGFEISKDGFMQVFKGARTHDSSTDKTWSYFLPWTQWRLVRYSLYDTKGQLFAEHSGKGSSYELRKQCPSVKFLFEDYDGQQITATTVIEERQWERGEGRFKWLSWFYKPMIRRELNLEFSSEVGREKGSWKGGTIGHGIDMLPGEMHEDAFKRYCENEHRSKSGKYKIKFIEQVI